MRVGVIGDNIHAACKALKFKQENHYLILREIAEFLAEMSHDIIVIPELGSVPEFIAEVYRENDGNKVIGVVPMQDRGLEELNSRLCDEMVNCRKWSNCSETLIEKSEILIALSLGPRAMMNICTTKWHPKVLYIVEDLITQRIPLEVQNQLNLKYIKKKELEKILKAEKVVR